MTDSSILLRRIPSDLFDFFVDLWHARFPVGPLVCLTVSAARLRNRNLAVADVLGAVDVAALASDIDTVLLIVEDPALTTYHLMVRSFTPDRARSIAERFGGHGDSVSAGAVLPRHARLAALRDTIIHTALTVCEEMS